MHYNKTEKESFLKKRKRVIIYFLCCLLCFAANWTVYTLMTKALNVDLSEVGETGNAVFSVFSGESGSNLYKLLACTFTAWTVNLLVSFTTNKMWVFKSRNWSPKVVGREFLTFLGGHLFTGVIDWFGTPLLVMLGMKAKFFGIEGAAAKLTVSIIIMFLNYFLSKLLVFKKKSGNNTFSEEEENGL